jgi:hypothetical protein
MRNECAVVPQCARRERGKYVIITVYESVAQVRLVDRNWKVNIARGEKEWLKLISARLLRAGCAVRARRGGCTK